ncbi:hypothetical protein PUN28_010369 [Cardiocondyla obscurior]|uniref:Uncharacterized protein n=1 Tax=Cardiocondyla obscurior TaxID=286306 RepID=A0AAW2FUA9_9HYME
MTSVAIKYRRVVTLANMNLIEAAECNRRNIEAHPPIRNSSSRSRLRSASHRKVRKNSLHFHFFRTGYRWFSAVLGNRCSVPCTVQLPYTVRLEAQHVKGAFSQENLAPASSVLDAENIVYIRARECEAAPVIPGYEGTPSKLNNFATYLSKSAFSQEDLALASSVLDAENIGVMLMMLSQCVPASSEYYLSETWSSLR